MLRPFPGFAAYPTHHCVTGSLKHVCDYHGHPVSEDLLLGLGRGLGFAYFHIKGTDPFYGAGPTLHGPAKRAWRKQLAGEPGWRSHHTPP